MTLGEPDPIDDTETVELKGWGLLDGLAIVHGSYRIPAHLIAAARVEPLEVDYRDDVFSFTGVWKPQVPIGRRQPELHVAVHFGGIKSGLPSISVSVPSRRWPTIFPSIEKAVAHYRDPRYTAVLWAAKAAFDGSERKGLFRR